MCHRLRPGRGVLGQDRRDTGRGRLWAAETRTCKAAYSRRAWAPGVTTLAKADTLEDTRGPQRFAGLPSAAHLRPLDTILSARGFGGGPSPEGTVWGPGSPRAGQIGSGAPPRYLQRDDVPSPEVDVDGVQRGWQRHPLPLAVDGGREQSWRWGRETAEAPYGHLEGDSMSRRVRAVPRPWGGRLAHACTSRGRDTSGPPHPPRF